MPTNSETKKPQDEPIELNLEGPEGQSVLIDVIYEAFEDSEACEEMRRNPEVMTPRRKK